jgi:NAD(P)H dehydrogenase (quinone)
VCGYRRAENGTVVVSIVITGASGRLGRLTAERVLERDAPGDVVLVTRHPERLADLAARGAVVRAGDFDRPDTLAAAFAGCRRLLLTSTSAVGRRVPQHEAAIAAAAAAAVDHVVYTSLPSPTPDNPALVTQEHGVTEGLLRESGLRWTVLRNAIYAEEQIAPGRRALRTGVLLDNRGDGRGAFVARADCGAVAAVVLTSDGHEGAVYDVTGPERVSSADVAGALAAVAGRPVRHESVPDDAFAEHLLRTTDMTEHCVQITVTLGRAIREGRMDLLTTVVADLTGRLPRPVGDVLAERRADLGLEPSSERRTRIDRP